MNITKYLYQLQELDLEIESNQQSLQQITRQLGDNQTVVKFQMKLAQEKQSLEAIKTQQQSAEWEIDDLENKITAAEKDLYSGKIGNPKELTSLQHEVNTLKAKRNQSEDKALEIIDQTELIEANLATLNIELKKVTADWQREQQKLSAEMEKLNAEQSNLKHKRQTLLAEIQPQTVELYHELREQKGRAVARIEQGICGSCRISLPITDLQRARSGELTQCSSCRRILFQA